MFAGSAAEVSPGPQPQGWLRQSMTDAARSKATVYVAGLESAVDGNILADAFMPFGEIVDITLPKPELPSSTDPHRGFGYIEFESPADAKEAIYNMDQSEIFGRVIKVAQAKPQKDASEGLGSKTAVWEQEGYLAKHAVRDEDTIGRSAAEEDEPDPGVDPMQGLEAADIAGPKPI
ncbi:uncharacterized protein KY384_004449 [Bacidia gigantensis]|uniref:uncharacterized protein n=1 Tax=Bacidia gigantensis TaxID=2732470 RepID=UPI001D046F1C|nr:uncharacterized protein KY384_004449 [Bacidia gigantensis]KAG8531092.1 hypothetical protein KY384_004449 [Bacidia gigantensis]